MRTTDYAYTRTKVVTKKAVVLSALDAFIAGLVMIFFMGILLTTLWMIFGH